MMKEEADKIYFSLLFYLSILALLALDFSIFSLAFIPSLF